MRKVKRPMLRFQSYEEMMSSAKGQSTTKVYIEVCTSIADYEKTLFTEFCADVNKQVLCHLKDNILKTSDNSQRVVVNFNRRLMLLIRETKYLDRMGFTIPDTALNVTLQEHKLQVHVQSLECMLEDYEQALASLSPIEHTLMSFRIGEMKKSIQVIECRSTRMTCIPFFTENC